MLAISATTHVDRKRGDVMFHANHIFIVQQRVHILMKRRTFSSRQPRFEITLVRVRRSILRIDIARHTPASSSQPL